MKAVAPVASRAVLTLAVALGASFAAWADDDLPRRRLPRLPAYAQECASCHIAYPPGLLAAASWRRLMADLPHHFGTDATLDAASVRTLTDWLVANAGTGRRVDVAPPQDRITRSRGFMREHGEVPAAAWTRPAVRSPSNCSACHARAEQGVFDEHDVRIPR